MIDDEQTVLTFTKSILENDYDVTTVDSGKEALNLFFKGYVPHLVLLDLRIPEMDGWNTFTRIHGISKLHSIPVAIYSVLDEPEDRAKAKEMGAVDYILKPVNKTTLLATVSKLVG